MLNSISEEFEYVEFGDKRLKDRLVKISQHFFLNPGESIPKSFDNWSEVKGAYRFFASGKVNAREIRDSSIRKTSERISKYNTILAIQDTTDLDFTEHTSMKGIGYLDNLNVQGMKVHTTLAANTEGLPLGIISQKIWAREKEKKGKKKKNIVIPTKDKESQRWLDALEETQKVVPSHVHVVTVADRESDMYDFMAKERTQNSDFLIRAYHRRKIKGENKELLEKIESQPIEGKVKVKIENTRSRKGRITTLSIRFGSYEFIPPGYKRGSRTLHVQAILVKEEGNLELKKNEKPLRWLLLTSMKVNSVEEALLYVDWYKKRWLIERYHYTLKSGCKIEELQLEEKSRIEKAFAVYCVVAYFLLWLTYESRMNPNESCEKVFSKEEWQTLYRMSNKTKKVPRKAPSLREAVRMIAHLGGFLGRKSDGEPGVKTIWRGLKDLVVVLEYKEFIPRNA
jgi:hypothetical protein